MHMSIIRSRDSLYSLGNLTMKTTTRVTSAMFVLVALLALTPGAYASPPDQTWIPGLYDNADFDDVVLFIAGNPGAVEHSEGSSVHPPVIVVGSVAPAHIFAPTVSSLSCGPV